MSDSEANFNQQIIAEFRANGGKVGGYFSNTPLLLLHTVGAKSGQLRINPLAYVADGENLVIIASNSGAASNPSWYHNVLANPHVTIEVGAERFAGRATVVASGPERARLMAKMIERNAGFADYERDSVRSIPAVVIERVA